MGTSLSGLTPATTFDGLLKTSDNEPLDGTLKAISTGDGTDTILQLSNSALQIGGATGMYWDNTNKRLGINNTSPAAPLEVNGEIRSTSLIRLMIGGSNKVLMQNANTIINSDVAIGQATAPTSRLHIKGSGATSATTSLLVQNSAGSDVLQTLDNGSVGVGGPANSSYRVTMTSGVLRLKDLLFGQTGSTSINNTNLLTMKWNGSTGIGISGNGAIDATARLHVKGSGNTNTTTSLLVQNSDATELLKVTDDGATTIKSNGSFSFETIAGTKRIEVKANGEVNLKGGQLAAYSSYNSSNSSLIVGNFTSPTARLQVKGSGATSATTALLVQNSAGTELLKVVDDGQLEIKSNSGRVSTTSGTSIFSYSSGGGGVLDVNPSNNNSVKFRARGDNDTFLIQTNPAGDNVGIGASSPDSTAKLQVDSTTQGFLPPRMTTTERDAITTPAAGLMIYNTTTNKAQCYNGTAWQDLF